MKCDQTKKSGPESNDSSWDTFLKSQYLYKYQEMNIVINIVFQNPSW